MFNVFDAPATGVISGVLAPWTPIDRQTMFRFDSSSPASYILADPSTFADADFYSGKATWYANAGSGAVTINAPSGVTIDGAASVILTQNQMLGIVSDGSNYFTVRGASSGGSGSGGLTQLDQTVLSAAASSITFVSIPQTATNLLLVITGETANETAENVKITFNADTTDADYQWAAFGYTPGSGVGYQGLANDVLRIGMLPPSSFDGPGATIDCTIGNYASTVIGKSVTSKCSSNSGVGIQLWQFGGFWTQTPAITRIDLVTDSGSDFAAGTVATLYGMP